jgi:hypothetical protein
MSRHVCRYAYYFKLQIVLNANARHTCAKTLHHCQLCVHEGPEFSASTLTDMCLHEIKHVGKTWHVALVLVVEDIC